MRNLTMAAAALAAMLAAAGTASATDYPHAMTGKAKIACAFEADLVFGRKIDQAPKYVTANFVDHNTQANSKTVGEFQAALAKMPKFPGPASGCGDKKVILNQGDYVMFLSETPRGSHFDVYRFEGDKIAEHWD